VAGEMSGEVEGARWAAASSAEVKA
jgi:hypothetical protein